jgi:hypothetical protein
VLYVVACNGKGLSAVVAFIDLALHYTAKPIKDIQSNDLQKPLLQKTDVC